MDPSWLTWAHNLNNFVGYKKYEEWAFVRGDENHSDRSEVTTGDITELQEHQNTQVEQYERSDWLRIFPVT